MSDKCDNCQMQFVCQSETGDCNEMKERYTPAELDEPIEFIAFITQHNEE